MDHGQLQIETVEKLLKFLKFARNGTEMGEMAALRRVGRRMSRILAPFDEEGQQSAMVVPEL